MPPRRKSPRRKQPATSTQDDTIDNTEIAESSPKRKTKRGLKGSSVSDEEVRDDNENENGEHNSPPLAGKIEKIDTLTLSKLATIPPPPSQQQLQQQLQAQSEETDSTIEQAPSPEILKSRQLEHDEYETSSPKRSKFNDRESLTSNNELPTKKTFTVGSHTNTVGEYKLPSESTVSALFQRKDMKSLVGLLSDLSNNKTERMFNDFKKLTERKQNITDNLVNNLTKENQSLKGALKVAKHDISNKNESESLKRQLDSLKKEHNGLKTSYSSMEAELKELRAQNKALKLKLNAGESSSTQVVKELDLFSTKLEIMELLTELSCIEYIENTDNLIFKMRQSGTTCSLTYRLLISKSEVTEIVYIPSIDDDAEDDDGENLLKLKKCLPDYLLDNLTFPSNTLYNFYNKLARSLNKPI